MNYKLRQMEEIGQLRHQLNLLDTTVKPRC